MDRSVFYERLDICKRCDYWKGSCVKGHMLQGALGCPVLKFDGIDGAGNMTDLPVPTPQLPAVGGTGCCGASVSNDLKPMSWGQVLKQFAASMQSWEKSGFLTVSREVYAKRLETCRNCNNYQWFQCKVCSCLPVVKAKLVTERCPKGFWEA